MIEKICLRQGLGWHGCDSTSKPEIENQSQFKLDIELYSSNTWIYRSKGFTYKQIFTFVARL